MLLALSALGVGFNPAVAVPLVCVGVGVAILWRQADDDAAQAVAGGGRRRPRLPGALRAAGGVALRPGGWGGVLAGPADLGGTAGGLVAALVVAAGSRW